eukprot:10807527-Ditylum_brightwellii.AAC.1
MAATADKHTMEELATTNRELSEANKLFTEQLGTLTDIVKQLTQKVESVTKQKPTQPPRQQGNIDWDPIGFVGVVDGKWTSATPILLATAQNRAIRKGRQGQTIWDEVIGTRDGMDEIKEGQ